jgi:hypothetical protein
MSAIARHSGRPGLALTLPACLLLATSATLAQEPTVPADPPPAGSPQVVPEKIEPDRPIGGPPPPPPGETLSDELSRTNGVIQPPKGVDPEMVEPPPDDGAAVGPVIKPPPPSPPAE